MKTRDRIGLLHDLLRVIHELELDLDLARIDTRGDEAVDTFFVRDDHGRPLDGPRLAMVEDRLSAAVTR